MSDASDGVSVTRSAAVRSSSRLARREGEAVTVSEGIPSSCHRVTNRSQPVRVEPLRLETLGIGLEARKASFGVSGLNPEERFVESKTKSRAPASTRG